jgi:serine/threonine protein kinase
MEILAGLGYAHTRRSPAGEPLRIIHRDLSPSNVLCSGEGEVKLSDFGIAKAVTYSSVFYRVRGKVGYMSPEMAHNQPIDARSDLFSLGVSIYETLIGERIYTGDLNTPPEKIYAQAVPPLASRCPGIPSELQGVLDRAMAIHPDERFPDAESFSQALRQVAIAHGLLYSAPQLAAELRAIMGPDPENWLSEQHSGTGPRASRPMQVPSTRDDDSLMEPGASISGGEDDVDLKGEQGGNVATPPPPAAATSLPGTRRPSGTLPMTGPAPQGTAPAPPPPPTWNVLFTPTPHSGATPDPAAEPLDPMPTARIRPPRRPTGGVAAIKRSRRGLWIFLAVIVIAAGYGIVRFVMPPGWLENLFRH